jgi:hypothetical protein
MQEDGMSKFTKQLATKGRAAAKNAYKKVETKVLVAEGRKSVRGKVRAAAKVSKEAVKAGLVAGALAAAGVVVREIRKRRKLD